MGKRQDITGRTSGKLTVVKLSDKKKNKCFLWECLCECGNTVYVATQLITAKQKKSCGCDKINLVDKKINNLTVIEKAEIVRFDENHTWRLWLCKCDCGNYTKQPTSELTSKKIKSCGCISRTSGEDNRCWKGYKQISSKVWGQITLCATKRNLEFTITKEYIWELFLKQDKKCALSGEPIIFTAPKNGSDTTASLDRIDSSMGYVPGNVQWVHKDINKMKSNYTDEYFISLCKKVANNNS